MLMRFHWGLGVGHVHTHQQLCTNTAVIWSNTESNQIFQSRNVSKSPEPPEQMGMEEDIVGSGTGTDDSGSEPDDDDYEPSEGDDDDDESSDYEDDEEHLLDIQEMYGSLNSDDD